MRGNGMVGTFVSVMIVVAEKKRGRETVNKVRTE
jgi:hypothetical protein